MVIRIILLLILSSVESAFRGKEIEFQPSTAATTNTTNVAMPRGVYAIMSSEPKHGRGKYVAEKSPMHLFVKKGIRAGRWIGTATGAILNAVVSLPFVITLLPVVIGAVGVALIAIPIHYYLRSDALVLSRSRMIRWDVKPILGSEDNEFMLCAVFEETEDQIYLSASSNFKNVEMSDPIPVIAIDAGEGHVYLQLQESSGEKWLYAGTERERERVSLEMEKKTKWKFIPQEYASDLSIAGPMDTLEEHSVEAAAGAALSVGLYELSKII